MGEVFKVSTEITGLKKSLEMKGLEPRDPRKRGTEVRKVVRHTEVVNKLYRNKKIDSGGEEGSSDLRTGQAVKFRRTTRTKHKKEGINKDAENARPEKPGSMYLSCLEKKVTTGRSGPGQRGASWNRLQAKVSRVGQS